MRDRARRVIWAEAAVRDLEDIISFVAIDSSLDAKWLLGPLSAKARSLETRPHRGRIVPELLRFGMRTWRELVVRPYRLVYRVAGETVVVLALLDGRRELEDVLLERLIRSR
jgi:plasmid stabilization system protein ParE